MIISILFILLWSSGYIAMKAGLLYTQPFTFLALRLLISSFILLFLVLISRAKWPKGRRSLIATAVAGILMQVGYQGTSFLAIKQELPLGILALIMGMQPLLTAFVAFAVLKQKIFIRQWIGLLLGLLGLGLIVMKTVGIISFAGAFFAAISVICITLGTFIQKEYCDNVDLRTGMLIQYSISAVIVFLIAYYFEGFVIHWTVSFTQALAWLVLAGSLASTYLYYYLIKKGNIMQVTSLMYFIPGITTLLDFFFFNTKISYIEATGMLIVLLGIVLVNSTTFLRKLLDIKNI